MKAIVERFGPMLVPVDEISESEINKLPKNTPLSISIGLSRNPANHRRFMKFLRVTFDIQDHFDNFEVWRKYIEMRAGYFNTVVTPTGKTLFMHKSIAYDKMDELEFREMFKKCIDAFVKLWGDRITEKKLMEVVSFD